MIIFFSSKWISFDKIINYNFANQWLQDFLNSILMNWMSKVIL